MKYTIEELRALEKAATPGPWHTFTIASPTGISERLFSEQGEHSIDLAHIPMPWPKNGQFICTIRNALPDVLDLLEEARELAHKCERWSIYRPQARAFLAKLEKEKE